MTLIASFAINGIPVFIGDLLISRESGNGDQSVSTPSVHKINLQNKKPNSLRIVGMSQKVNLVSDKICVLWSGTKYKAQGFIRYLRNSCGEGPLTYDQFNQLVDGYPIENSSDLNLIVYFYGDKTFWMRQINTPHFYFDGSRLDAIQVAGSGQAHFIQVIEELTQVPKIEGQHTALDEIISLGLGFASMAMGNQVLTGFGVDEGWGGGFEVAYPRLGRFEKLSDVMYLYWLARELNDGSFEIKNLPRFIKTEYQGLRLKMFVCDWSEEFSGERLYIVDPLFEIDKSEEVTVPKLNYTWLVNYCQVVDKNGSATFYNRIDRFGSSGGSERPITVKEHKEKFEMEFNAEWVKKMISQITKIEIRD